MSRTAWAVGLPGDGSLDDLVAHLKPVGSAVVAISGGVDSTLAAWAAHVTLGDQALAVTACSESMTSADAAALRALGFAELRVRHHGSTARIELPKAAMARVLSDGLAEGIVRRVREAGFAFVALDLEGLRSGSLNRLLIPRGRDNLR